MVIRNLEDELFEEPEDKTLEDELFEDTPRKGLLHRLKTAAKYVFSKPADTEFKSIYFIPNGFKEYEPGRLPQDVHGDIVLLPGEYTTGKRTEFHGDVRMQPGVHITPENPERFRGNLVFKKEGSLFRAQGEKDNPVVLYKTGGIRLANGTMADLKHLHIINGNGTGIYAGIGTRLVLEDSLIEWNRGSNGGGGIHLQDVQEANFLRNSIKHNIPSTIGGGIYGLSDRHEFVGNTVKQNHLANNYVSSKGKNIAIDPATKDVEGFIVYLHKNNNIPRGEKSICSATE